MGVYVRLFVLCLQCWGVFLEKTDRPGRSKKQKCEIKRQKIKISFTKGLSTMTKWKNKDKKRIKNQVIQKRKIRSKIQVNATIMKLNE